MIRPTLRIGLRPYASAWDSDLLFRYGKAMATEQRNKGMHVLLGPGVNLARVPTGGRNFEYQERILSWLASWLQLRSREFRVKEMSPA